MLVVFAREMKTVLNPRRAYRARKDAPSCLPARQSYETKDTVPTTDPVGDERRQHHYCLLESTILDRYERNSRSVRVVIGRRNSDFPRIRVTLLNEPQSALPSQRPRLPLAPHRSL
jgi:hypothetical protein